jgi:hypothetical protein
VDFLHILFGTLMPVPEECFYAIKTVVGDRLHVHGRVLLQQHFGVAPPDSDYQGEALPGYMAPVIRLPHADAVSGDRACALGMFGMVPHLADTKLASQTYNARFETVATKPTFRHAYQQRQLCIVPLTSFLNRRMHQARRSAGKLPMPTIDRWPLPAFGKPSKMARTTCRCCHSRC